MIETKLYTEKEGRDPNIYLGIDGNDIPLKYFKGLFSDSGTVYTDDFYSGIQFIVNKKEDALSLITTNPNEYVTREDIESNDVWFKISHQLYEGPTAFMSIQQSLENDPYHTLLEDYYNGKTGLLEFSKITYNDKGEYMKVYKSFDTRPHPEDQDIRGSLLRHINFVYWQDIKPWEERVMEVRTNEKNNEMMFQLLVKPQLDILLANKIIASTDNNLGYSYIMAPPFGRMELVIDNTIEDFLITKKDK